VTKLNHVHYIIKAQNEALNVDDIVNMIQFGHPFKVVEDIPAELPPGPDIPKYKDVANATVDKEDKKANKLKDKAEKRTLIPTQTKEEVEVDEASATGIPLSKALAGITTPPKQKKGFRVFQPASGGFPTPRKPFFCFGGVVIPANALLRGIPVALASSTSTSSFV
jgi:hypothetical protein